MHYQNQLSSMIWTSMQVNLGPVTNTRYRQYGFDYTSFLNRFTSLLLIFLVCMIILAVLFGSFLQIGYLYKSKRIKEIALIQLAWLIGNFPYRFLSATYLDLVLITGLEIWFWAEGDHYFSSAMKASAVLGAIYCSTVLGGFIVYVWSAFLSRFKVQWPWFNSEVVTSAWNVWAAGLQFVFFMLYRYLLCALVIVNYGDNLTLPQTIISFVITLLFSCFYL